MNNHLFKKKNHILLLIRIFFDTFAEQIEKSV